MRNRAAALALAIGAFASFVPFATFDAQAPANREDAYRQNNLGVARLEQYDFPGASAAFRRALEIDRHLAVARLNLAIALLYAGQPESAAPEARAAVQALSDSPQAHYVAGLVARAENRLDDARSAFRRVLQLDGEDVGSRVQLAQAALGEQKYAEAMRLFDEAVRLEPFNATAMYGLGTALTRAGDRTKGADALARFERLRNNPAAITYSATYLEQGRYGEALASTGAEPDLVDPTIPPVAFADATAALLPSAPQASGMTLFDADGDGDLDLALLAANRVSLVRNATGRLAAAPAVIVKSAGEFRAAIAGDYDNDARPDLFVQTRDGGRLLQQRAGGTWRDVTAEGKLPAIRPSSAAAWADVDHDGDLDLLTGAPQLLRNNGNGSFADITGEARLAQAPAALAIVPTDFDNRRDRDLLLLPGDGAPALMANQRDGTFRDVAADIRMAEAGRYRTAAAGDANKDGITDFFFGRAGARGRFVMSRGPGRFTFVDAPADTADATAALLLDYDNDGLLDLLSLTPRGPRLWRQTAREWSDVTDRAFPPALREDNDPALALEAGDLDDDGDTDLVVRLSSGRIRLWRNDGGSRQASLKVRLAARVSNRSAIGARVEMRAGSLRQHADTVVATPPVMPSDLVFGLGSRSRADVVRVLWPAGILQAETVAPPARGSAAGRTTTITELNRKPSSCPFLYTWNGSRFEFVTDFMGGGEMGAWAGPGAWNVPDSDEYVRIRGDQLRPKNGRYELRVTSELEEVVFVDRLHLVAVSHPANADIYPNEGLRSPAARQPFALTTITGARPPRRVVDHHGHDMLDRVAALDRRVVDDFTLESIQGYAEKHWLTIDLGLAASETRAALLLTGWTDYAFSSDNVAAHQARLAAQPPSLEVKTADGRWQTAIADIGLPVGRPQTVVVDISSLVARGVREVRIVTTLRVYWDQILVGRPEPMAIAQHTIEPATATLASRGFSAETSPDGKEPWGYDYQRVSAHSPWKRMPGRYTREGDVRPLLSAIDDMFVIAAPGDEIALSFDAGEVATPPPGWTTTFLLFADGFSKEMNVRSASPDHVEPLPFHGMSAYPYPSSERYPYSLQHQRYRATFNTRVVGRPLPPLDIPR